MAQSGQMFSLATNQLCWGGVATALGAARRQLLAGAPQPLQRLYGSGRRTVSSGLVLFVSTHRGVSTFLSVQDKLSELLLLLALAIVGLTKYWLTQNVKDLSILKIRGFLLEIWIAGFSWKVKRKLWRHWAW